MEAAVVSVGKAALHGLLSGAKAAITEDAALTQAVQRDVVFLTDELAAMRSFLRDADEERNRHKVPISRVRHVRDLAYDVEDCLEEYAVHLEKPSGWRLARTVLGRHRIAEEMKGLRTRAEDMNHRNLRYHLADNNPSSNPAAASSAERPNTLGTGVKRQVDLFFESEQVDLVPLIRDNDQQLRVIAVWGTSSCTLRKMSIVRRAYDDLKRNKALFGFCAWIRVMHPFDPSSFLHSIMRQFYGNFLQEAGKTQEEATLGAQVQNKMRMMKQEDLVDEFNEHVTRKSYLIVLNGLSTIEDWDWIKTYFLNNKKGSRIIVSTEQGEVASLCAGPERLVVELKQSSADQTIYAFCEKGTTEPGPSSKTATIDSNCPLDGKRLIRIESMIDTVKESHLIGRQKEISDIIKLISDEQSKNQSCEVISICGEGGLGKTTLVKHIFQHQKLRSMFDKRAFVTVKGPFDPKELLGSLATQLGEKKPFGGGKTKPGDPQCWVDLIIKGKKYLIVLDDLASTTEWDALEHHYPITKIARWIIVTTGVEDIAKHCSGEDKNIFKLKSLGNMDVRDLFIKKVFWSTINLRVQYPDSVEEARSIVAKCNGSPLAVIAIGGHLAKRPKTVVEWRKLNEYIGSELEINQGPVAMTTILTKCYDSLPYDLKSCFLYLSIFPRDYNISRRRLVHRWTAEGYSSKVHGKYDNEISDSYFMELMEKTLIEPFVESIGSTKVINSCKVNDLIHEISTLKSVEENLIFRLEEGCGLNTQGKMRHVAITDKWNGSRNEFENIVNPCNIRSLTVFGKWRPFFISEKMRMLRVLDLEGTLGLVDHHLEHIGKLLHLKYLSLRRCRDICYLPHSLGNLRQLETLDIKHTAIIKLPRTTINLRKLHYLRAGRFGVLGASSYEEAVGGLPKVMRHRLCVLTLSAVIYCVACCSSQLMKTWCEDRKRRDVCTAWCCTVAPFVMGRLDSCGVVPCGISKLTALSTLGTVNVGRGKAILQEIKRLTRLCKLGVTGVNKNNSEEFCSALSSLSNLKSLSVRSVGKKGLEGCLKVDDSNYSPPENLKCLKLYGKLVKLPEWINGLRNLMKLSLRNSSVSDHVAAMQVLGKLRKLSILHMREKTFEGEKLCFTFDDQAFPSLKVLVLRLVGDLKSVEFKEGAMPNLELLQFCGWPNDTNAGFFSGLASLRRLKEFMLDNDDYKEEFLKNVQDPLAKNPNGPVLMD